MSSRIVSWVFILLVCLALIAALFIVIGFLADQTGEASLVHNQSNLPVSLSSPLGAERRQEKIAAAGSVLFDQPDDSRRGK
jgi:hypothetical protein